jgi:hypothetical protein
MPIKLYKNYGQLSREVLKITNFPLLKQNKADLL